MHINIKETVGEASTEHDITGDYEEVLALVTELGFCKETVFDPKIIVNTNIQKSTLDALKDYYRKWIADEKRPGGLLA